MKHTTTPPWLGITTGFTVGIVLGYYWYQKRLEKTIENKAVQAKSLQTNLHTTNSKTVAAPLKNETTYDDFLDTSELDMPITNTNNEEDTYAIASVTNTDSFSGNQYKRLQKRQPFPWYPRQAFQAVATADLKTPLERTQLTLTNHSLQAHEVTLWGGNEKPPILAEDPQIPMQTGLSIPTGNAPIAMYLHPLEDVLLVVNQLANTLTRYEFTTANQQTISVVPNTNIAGQYSPVAIAFEITTGTMFVANSVADTVSVLTSLGDFITEIPVGKRPIAIAYHHSSETILVANLSSDTITVIDAKNHEVLETLSTRLPDQIIVADRWEGFAVLSRRNAVLEFWDGQGNLNASLTIAAMVTAVVSTTHRILWVYSESEGLLHIDLDTFEIIAQTPLSAPITQLLLLAEEEVLYLVSPELAQLFVFDINIGDFIAPLPIANLQAPVLQYSAEKYFVLDSLAQEVKELSLQASVTINPEYYARREEFTHQPAQLHHAKFVLSGTERFAVLALEQQSIHGAWKRTPISLRNYESPQNFSNVSEVTALQHTLVDGRTRWRFEIAPKQTITIILQYQQKEALLEQLRALA